MRGIVFGGEVRYVRDLPVPVRAPGEALIRPTLAGLCATDREIAKGYMAYAGVLGHEFVGVVEEADDPALAGQRVVGEINAPCGLCDTCRAGRPTHCPHRTVLGIMGRDGAFADLFTLPVDSLHPVPAGVADEAAVFAEPLAAAFEIAAQIDLVPMERIVLLGDGKLGLLIALMFASLGLADRVTLVGRHPERARRLAPPGITVTDLPLPQRSFDLAVDATGSPHGIGAALDAVRPRGTVVLKTTVHEPAPLDTNRLVIDEITLVGSRCGPFAPALMALASGAIDPAPLVSATVSLEEGAALLKSGALPGDSVKILIDPTK
ncbi:MAG: alcohol dehydrogenase catalytic domain-containing protein [Nitrospinae bacterium]|nr:alcohol dehydrogenase catalytic domain-containing protein [Nitrospinota bacterium]